MKKFRKLIPAMCMLLISAVLVGTSTFAWFSMQKTVTVTGLEVTAKTDQPYLIIGNSTKNTAALLQALPTATEGENGNTTASTIAAADAKVSPCEYKSTVTSASALATVSNWYYAVAEKTSASTAKSGTDTDLTTFDGYVLTQTVYMTIAKNTPTLSDITANVTFTAKGTTTKKVIDAARVVLGVSVDEADKSVKEFTSDTGSSAISLGTGDVTDSTLVKVAIYIFIDGTDDTIFTDNLANLDGASIGLSFNAVVKTATAQA